MKIYTRTGDDGNTSLLGGKRVSKYHVRVEAYGSVDELISWIGLLKEYPENSQRKGTLVYIQDQLMRCASALATDPESDAKGRYLPDADCTAILEKEIDEMGKNLKKLDSFILPGGNILVSNCHITRCVCRRAERAVLRLNQTDKTPDIIFVFLNRLADYLFILSRKICYDLDIEEDKWQI